MLTDDQISQFTKKFKTNATFIIREYIQILFLSILSEDKDSSKLFFKGGTAIHFIYKAPRFSEDLDFTSHANPETCEEIVIRVSKKLAITEFSTLNKLPTIAGKSYRLTISWPHIPYKIYIKIDCSFREKVLFPEKSIIDTPYPVLMRSYIYHLSKDEIFAEKIRAVMTRKKGRDIYDIWYLLTQNVSFKSEMIQKKLDYYKLSGTSNNDILERVNAFDKSDFVKDLRPFIPLGERDKLGGFFDYVKNYLKNKLDE